MSETAAEFDRDQYTLNRLTAHQSEKVRELAGGALQSVAHFLDGQQDLRDIAAEQSSAQGAAARERGDPITANPYNGGNHSQQYGWEAGWFARHFDLTCYAKETA